MDKLIDITNFSAKNDIKPILQYVKVDLYDDKIVYVTTDAFRLVEATCTNGLSFMFEGYYHWKIWKDIVKEFNKKTPDVNKLKALSLAKTDLTENYPDYKNIIPISIKNVDWDSIVVNQDYFNDMLQLIKTPTNSVSLYKIKISKDNKMLYYYENDLKILLMLIDK